MQRSPWWLAFLVLAACGKGATHVPLGKTGWVVDAPASWRLETHSDHWFTMHSPKLGHGFDVQLDEANPAQPPRVERLRGLVESLRCTDPASAVTGATPHGGLYARCKVDRHGKTVDALLVAITAGRVATGCSVHGAPAIDADDAAACMSLHHD